MVVFQCPQVAWQFQTPYCFPAVKQGLILEEEAEKKHLSEWAQRQKAIGGIYFTKKWRTETLQPGLGFDNFKPWLESNIFKCISCLNGLFFGGDVRGFLKEGVRTYLMAPMSPLRRQILFCLHVYSLCCIPWTMSTNTNRTLLVSLSDILVVNG